MHILQQRSAVLHSLREALDYIVQSLDISKDVCAQRDRMAQLALQGDDILPLHAVEVQLHGKTPILSQRNRVGGGHIAADFQNSGTGCFFTAVDNTLNYHGREAIFVGAGMFLGCGNIRLQALHDLFVGCNFLGKLLDDLILQCVPLAQMGGFHKP